MEKQKFTATFNGSCYINAYGRKFYKKGYSLINIKDEKGNKIPDQKISQIKSFDIIADKSAKQNIEFEAKFDGNKLSYISNVKIAN